MNNDASGASDTQIQMTNTIQKQIPRQIRTSWNTFAKGNKIWWTMMHRDVHQVTVTWQAASLKGRIVLHSIHFSALQRPAMPCDTLVCDVTLIQTRGNTKMTQIHNALFCITTPCSVMHCDTLWCTVMHCNALWCTVMHGDTLGCTVMHGVWQAALQRWQTDTYCLRLNTCCCRQQIWRNTNTSKM